MNAEFWIYFVGATLGLIALMGLVCWGLDRWLGCDDLNAEWTELQRARERRFGRTDGVVLFGDEQ